jgi:hypothetical protein
MKTAITQSGDIMRATTVFSTLALTASLVAGGAILTPVVLAQMGGDAQPAASRQQWLSLSEIQQRLEAAGYRDIDKIEREDDYCEVKATDPDGRRVELKVDPVSGEVTKTEVKNGKRDERSMNGTRSDEPMGRSAARLS